MAQILSVWEKTKNKLYFILNKRNLYTVIRGTFSGEWFILKDRTNTGFLVYFFISKRIENIPYKDFYYGLKVKTFEKANSVPKDIYEFIDNDSLYISKYKKEDVKKTDMDKIIGDILAEKQNNNSKKLQKTSK